MHATARVIVEFSVDEATCPCHSLVSLLLAAVRGIDKILYLVSISILHMKRVRSLYPFLMLQLPWTRVCRPSKRQWHLVAPSPHFVRMSKTSSMLVRANNVPSSVIHPQLSFCFFDQSCVVRNRHPSSPSYIWRAIDPPVEPLSMLALTSYIPWHSSCRPSRL